VKAAIRPHDSVQHSSPTSLWKSCGQPRLWNRRRPLGFERAVRRPYDARPGLKPLERGTCGKNLGKSANFCQPFPNVYLRLPGSLFYAIGFTGVLLFNILILGNLIQSKTSTYGALGTAATLLLAFFVGRVIVGAAVLNATLYQRRTGPHEPQT
jgi:hypothetical protein